MTVADRPHRGRLIALALATAVYLTTATAVVGYYITH